MQQKVLFTTTLLDIQMAILVVLQPGSSLSLAELGVLVANYLSERNFCTSVLEVGLMIDEPLQRLSAMGVVSISQGAIGTFVSR